MLLGLLLSAAASLPATALDCAAAAALLRPDDAGSRAADADAAGRWCALATLPYGRWAAAVLGSDQTVTAAVLRVVDGTPAVSAGPVTRDTLELDPPWSPILQILPGGPADLEGGSFRVEYANAYASTGRAAHSRALYVFVPQGPRLLAAFAGWLELSQSWVVPCARPASVPCRAGWQRSYDVEPARARGTILPDLLVRDRHTRHVVSRHRWAGMAYRPAVFERTPPFLRD